MELTERYFRLLGWQKHNSSGFGEMWQPPSAMRKTWLRILPDILDSQAEFKKWVVVPMRERGYSYSTSGGNWLWIKHAGEPPTLIDCRSAKCEDDNIFAAAILGACEALEGEMKNER